MVVVWGGGGVVGWWCWWGGHTVYDPAFQKTSIRFTVNHDDTTRDSVR